MEDFKDLETKSHKDLDTFSQNLVNYKVQALLRSREINMDVNKYAIDSSMKESDVSIAF